MAGAAGVLQGGGNALRARSSLLGRPHRHTCVSCGQWAPFLTFENHGDVIKRCRKGELPSGPCRHCTSQPGAPGVTQARGTPCQRGPSYTSCPACEQGPFLGLPWPWP